MRSLNKTENLISSPTNRLKSTKVLSHTLQENGVNLRRLKIGDMVNQQNLILEILEKQHEIEVRKSITMSQ